MAAGAAAAPWLVRRWLPVADDVGRAASWTLVLGIKLVIEGVAVGCICGLVLMLLYGPRTRTRFAELEDVPGWQLPLHGVWAGALGWGVGGYVLGEAIGVLSSIAAAIIKAILGIPPLWVGWLVAAVLCGVLSFVVVVPFQACEKEKVERLPGGSRLMVCGVAAACLGAVLDFIYLRGIIPEGGPPARDVLIAPVLSRIYVPVGIAAGLLWGAHAAAVRQRGGFEPRAVRAHGVALGGLALAAGCVAAAGLARQDLVFIIANRGAVMRALAEDLSVVTRRDAGGRTPLHLACLQACKAALIQNASQIPILLDHGAGICARDDQGNTPRDIARRAGTRAGGAGTTISSAADSGSRLRQKPGAMR